MITLFIVTRKYRTIKRKSTLELEGSALRLSPNKQYGKGRENDFKWRSQQGTGKERNRENQVHRRSLREANNREKMAYRRTKGLEIFCFGGVIKMSVF